MRYRIASLGAVFLFITAGAACGGKGGSVNQAPEVSLEGPATIEVGETAHFVATATDPEGDPLTYRWSLTASPDASQVVISSVTATLDLVPDLEGRYQVTLSVTDGTSETTAQADLVATPPATLDGTLSVEVVDAREGTPIEGAEVRIEGLGLSGTTGTDGTVTLSQDGLVGPVTLHVYDPTTARVDHDRDPNTPAVPRLLRRGVTLQGIDRPQILVPLQPSGAAALERPLAVVHGTIDLSLFDHMPAIAPFLSFDVNEVTSSQIRAVLIAPVADGDASTFGVRDLLGRPAALGASLPGNLTTDDPFLNASAGLLGIPVGGQDPLLDFVVDAPVGTTRFFVLGVLIDIDAQSLVPLLGGGGTLDPAALFGSMGFSTLFVGMLDLDVPAGESTLLAPISDTGLDLLAEVPGTVTFEQSRGPWALDPSREIDLEQARFAPETVATVSAPAPLADPRVAANLPATTRVEITDAQGNHQNPRQYADLAVPDETGDPVTDVPYALVIATARGPEGLIPLGLAFTRVADTERPAARFGLPTFTGSMASASIEALVFTTRGMLPSLVDGAYEILPGLHLARLALDPTRAVASPAPITFPALDPSQDAGLDVRVLVHRADTSTTIVDGARAYLTALTEPLPSLTLPDPLSPALETPGPEVLHVVVAARTWGQVPDPRGGLRAAPFDDPLWDIYLPASAGSLSLPVLLSSAAGLGPGDEVRLRLREERFEAQMDLAHFSGERLLEGPVEVTSDDFLFYLP